ncbi:hypothetical protein [Leptolyngbya sp. 7M]|uniref:hypothetical protein n=1 Tax=Leptolyngbya sp. 7M TaxID=2812896 RepID=UPI001B8BB136|nr:hypothetical protein [Leptolyngbya sp. 7M]QYO64220.1 hypothetical protein JVX88_31550 [Leptolyngbya sp. 7M]
MPDAEMHNQATEPNQEIAASQQTQAFAPPNSGGSAMLDANIAAGETTAPKVEGAEEPIATNFSSSTGKVDAKTADVTTTAEAASAEEATEKGTVHLHQVG